MAVEIGTATSYLDLMSRFRRFITGRGKVLSNNYSGTGNGLLSNLLFKPAAVTETWTIACSAAAANAGTFTVVGSVSGAQPNATVGVPYSNASLSFTITDGTTDFVVGDAFTVSAEQGVMSADGNAWEELRWDVQSDTIGRDFYLKGKGLAGADEIFVQMKSYFSSVGDFYNIQLNGAIGYNAGAVPLYTGQPGYDGGTVSMALWNQSTPYWFIANGRRFIIIAKISTSYQSCYCGFILPYALPSEYPYPLAIGGNCLGGRWSVTDYNNTFFPNPNDTLRLLRPEGNWESYVNIVANGNAVFTSNVYPKNIYATRPSPDGTYSLGPLVLHSSASGKNVYGEFQGVKNISGYANASENTEVVGGVTWLTVQNATKTGISDYASFALE